MRFETYVTKSLRADAWIDFACAVASLIGGVLVLAASYCVAYFILWFLLPGNAHDLVLWSRIGAGIFVGLIIFGSWRTQRKLFEAYTNEASAGDDVLRLGFLALGLGRFGQGRLGGFSLLPLAPGTSRNLIKVAADMLYSGPRLLVNAYKLVLRGRARSSADYAGCARVLSMAFDTDGRLTLRKLADARPEIDLANVLEQLSWLGGIIFLEKEPQGITLTEGLRNKLRSADDSR